MEDATVIWICCIAITVSGGVRHTFIEPYLHVIQEIAVIPEIGVERHDPQLRILWMIDAISSIMRASFHRGGGSDPVILLP